MRHQFAVVFGVGIIGFGLMGSGCSSDSERNTGSRDVSDSSNSPSGKALRTFVTMYEARPEPAGTNCTNSGIALLSGPDRNENGRLDAGEVTSTKYVCNGAPGQSGPTGATGLAGKNALLNTEDVPLGSIACPTGGVAVSVGVDANANAVLDPSEVTGTKYLCNGSNGLDGNNGAPGLSTLVSVIPQALGSSYCPNGGQGLYTGLDVNGDQLLQPTEVQSTSFLCNGIDGTSAAAGADGMTALVKLSAELAGTNCEFGGNRVESGMDADRSGALEPAEVSQTGYACHGAPGATGPMGPVGPAGSAGDSTAIVSYFEPAGENCPSGGVRLDVGWDRDKNYYLDPIEIESTRYLCNGKNGDPVSGGYGALVVNYPSSRGEYCERGGVRILSGIDTNGDGTLANDEITHTQYHCFLRTKEHEYAGANCPNAGMKINIGFDNDGSNLLEPDEIENSSYFCYGNHTAAPKSVVTSGISCATLQDGTAYCWGQNFNGQIGDGTIERAFAATQVSGLQNVASIGLGQDHTCAVHGDGTVSCWGLNIGGQLGSGMEITGSLLPVKVEGLTDVVTVAGGTAHNCALSRDGKVRCLGVNDWGQLGDGTLVSSNMPVLVTGLGNVAAISAEGHNTCAVLTDGTARCWGWNDVGQLGDGTSELRSTPVTVLGLSGAVSISVSASHTCATVVDGTVRCWGNNASGQLGDGTLSSSFTPVVVAGLDQVVSATAGLEASCALMIDGTAKCWGSNVFGQVGNGSWDTAPVLTPSTVVGLSGILSLDAGGGDACAVTREGKVYCWGSNYSGALGDANTASDTSPIPVVVPSLGL